MDWEENFQISIADAEAAAIRTPLMATELICRKLGVSTSTIVGSCLTQRSFYRLRQALAALLLCPRTGIRPNTRLTDIIPRGRRRSVWRALPASAGVPALPRLLPGFNLPMAHRTLGDLACYVVAHHPRSLLEPHAGWTRRQVRAVVRAVVSEKLGVTHFEDNADFVNDLGLN